MLLLPALLLSASRAAESAGSDALPPPRPAYRIFQALPSEPSSMSSADVDAMRRVLRATQAAVFSSAGEGDGRELTLDVYTPSERREYLVRHGGSCGPANADADDSHDGSEPADVLSRYDALSSSPHPELGRTAIELWKLCVLQNGHGHAFLGWDEAAPLRPSLFRDEARDGNRAVVSTLGRPEAGPGGGDADEFVHPAFLSVGPGGRSGGAPPALASTVGLILETPDEVLRSSPLLVPREFRRRMAAGGEADGGGPGSGWTFLRNGCIPLAGAADAGYSFRGVSPGSNVHDGSEAFEGFLEETPASSAASVGRALQAMSTAETYAGRMASRCPLGGGGYCCLAFLPDEDGADVPVMALRHPLGGSLAGDEDDRMPYRLAADEEGRGRQKKQAKAKDGASSKRPASARLGGVPESDLPYISTVRLVRDDTDALGVRPSAATGFPSHPADLPNFFDILFENECLPYRKECHRCLKDVANERPFAPERDGDGSLRSPPPRPDGPTSPFAQLSRRNACAACQYDCPCYCDVLCRVRPPPKPVTRTYSVRPPGMRKEPSRHVPKIVHQTWFEPVTREKYPNMSRLIESWKKSGWEYYFYDDDTAGDFLGTHFPPEVREAYESITPGAFKADLFRYCVLLIRGGVYADMDVLLETNLDDAVSGDVGFMTPIDEPGSEVGRRSCLWNGLIASAPGHPYLARTVQIVVNNIRNRYTGVDYDDMMCPDPVLSVSHTVDTLFTCGPCILGAGINDLLGRHMQTQFETGDVDIWQMERLHGAGDVHGDDSDVLDVAPDDQRLLVPGRTVILDQNKNDMGAHRFTHKDRHLIVASTDMPDYDDRPPSKEHYSKTHDKAGVYGLRKLYTDARRANEEIRFVVEEM